MEIKGIEDPFKWSRDVVSKLQFNGKGLYYSPSRIVSKTSEGTDVSAYQIEFLDGFKASMGKYADYVINFIDDMNKIFNFGDDWGMYIPEVKYLSPEPLVNYNDLCAANGTYLNQHGKKTVSAWSKVKYFREVFGTEFGINCVIQEHSDRYVIMKCT